MKCDLDLKVIMSRDFVLDQDCFRICSACSQLMSLQYDLEQLCNLLLMQNCHNCLIYQYLVFMRCLSASRAALSCQLLFKGLLFLSTWQDYRLNVVGLPFLFPILFQSSSFARPHSCFTSGIFGFIFFFSAKCIRFRE